MPTFSRVAPSIHVADHARALRFYVEALGFTLDNIDDPPFRAVITHGPAVLHLDLNKPKAGTSSVHMIVRDLDGLCTRLRTSGVSLVQDPTVQPWGLRELVVADPDGNTLELAEPV